ncbi:MAG: 2Fe-2S iron-sulfur cluster-binding protein [Gammaproteobacteria bacterium]|nr:2Fe-2S iron-sulfur cluster-binding protein [Gammaproteobacteria bacterium]
MKTGTTSGPLIAAVTFNGTKYEIEGETGQSLMKNLLDNGIPGIDADCGGECSCATCHVILPEDWYAKLGEPSSDEEAMLGMNPEITPTSRLSCQIKVTDELDGLSVEIPEFQF